MMFLFNLWKSKKVPEDCDSNFRELFFMLVFALRLVFFFPPLSYQFDFDGGFCDRFHNLSKQYPK